MQTIKTAVVVVLLMVVLYGAYIAINGANTELPPELQAMLNKEDELEVDVSLPTTNGSNTLSSNSAFSTSSGENAQTTNSSPFKNSSSPKASSDNPFLRTSSSNAFPPPQLTAIPPANLKTTNNTDSLSNDKPIAPPKFTSVNEQNKSGLKLDPPTFGTRNDIDPSLAGSNSSDVASSEDIDEQPQFDPPSSNDEIDEASNALIPSTRGKKANLTGKSFESAKQVALEQIDRGELKDALATLTVFYGSPELSEEQTRDLIDLLDSLAGETIYSRRHLLDIPYPVGSNETIDSVAKKFEVPTELLARINGVDSTVGILPNTRLKVFRGPFRAEVDIKRNEMTVFLGELYAGRFPVSTGSDPKPKEGVFQVLDKQQNRNYYGRGGLQIDGTDPRNPFGGWWIDLGQEVSIHGSPTSAGSEADSLGCISLSPLDARDVYSMLSRGSQVTIKR